MQVESVIIFLGAFLLFSIQPIIAKVILPWFGGTAAVWTTCMLFFQVELLLGYLYTDTLVRRLRGGLQGTVHIVLLGISLLSMPIAPALPGPGDPTARILILLTTTIGIPYLMLASTAPLVQAWVARKKISPYRLYSLSNLASMLALIGYPVIAEPFLTVSAQKAVWSGGYVAFVLGCGYLAWRSRMLPGAEQSVAVRPKARPFLIWLVLSAMGCVLMMSVTNQLCQNIAAIPFLWVLPLSLYLATFIVAFQSPKWLHGRTLQLILIAGLGILAYGISDQFVVAKPLVQILVLPAGMTLACLFCHGELVNRKPDPSQLTGYYLSISLGGAIGGLLVGLAAPMYFDGYYELPVAVAACGIVALFLFYSGKQLYFDVAWMLMAALLVAHSATRIRTFRAGVISIQRNFYGVLRVADRTQEAVTPPFRSMVHGVIEHGSQFLDPARRRQPTTYFGPDSGAARAFRFADGPVKAGIIGLGAGTLALYGKPGDHFRFYEINPLVIHHANASFTYLSDSAAKIDMVEGDARISLENEPAQNYDVLVVDAFTGDAVPVHLLTREAFELYFRHLKPNGILAMHISNRYLDFNPVVERLAAELGKGARRVTTNTSAAEHRTYSEWMLVTTNQRVLAALPEPKRPNAPLWTDDYCNQFALLK